VRSSAPVRLAKRIGVLAATVVAAPTVAYVVFGALAGRLTEPVPAATWHYVVKTFWHFDLGVSGTFRQPVASVLSWSFPVDLAMVIGGLVCGTALGLLGGLLLASRPRSLTAAGLHGFTAFALASPPYWLGFMILMLFSPGIGDFVQVPFVSTPQSFAHPPGTVFGWLEALWVPWLVVGLPLAAQVLRMTSRALHDVLGDDALLTARAKGVPERRVIRRHALPLALAPIASLTGVNMAILITNVTLMESAFNLPGIFREVRDIANFGDFDLLQGMLIETTILIVVANMLADAVQARFDPAIR
jgi:peptide/nickel transport system permease protein